MKRFFFTGCLLLLGVFFSARAQDHCFIEGTKEKDISVFETSLLKSNAFTASIKIAFCYTQEKNIIYTIDYQFSMNGELVTEKKLRKHGHKLYLESLDFSPTDKFSLIAPVNSSEILENGSIFTFIPRPGANWQQQVFSSKLKFKYEVKDDSAFDEIKLSFLLPDNMPPVEEKNSIVVQDTVKEKEAVKPKVKIPVVKPVTVEEPTANATYKVMDSIKFYYNRIGDLVGLLDTKKSSVGPVLDRFINECYLVKTKFDEHLGNAGTIENTGMYSDEFYNFYEYIESELIKATGKGISPRIVQSGADIASSESESSEKGISISSRYENLIIYIIITAFGLSLLGFLYMKFR